MADCLLREMLYPRDYEFENELQWRTILYKGFSRLGVPPEDWGKWYEAWMAKHAKPQTEI